VLVIYIYRGEHRDRREELIREAVELYAKEEKGLSDAFFGDWPIKKARGGKPYLKGRPFHFSVSHTGSLWGCLISESNVGLDIQKIRAVDFNKLAARFFLDEEAEFVKNTGAAGFFDIWTRKEACVKYFGRGLLKDIRSFSVVRDGKPAGTVNNQGAVCHVNSFSLGEDVKCAYCCGAEGDKVWIRELK